MGRKALRNYIEVARTVLTELGGGPISSQGLVAAAQERGLISNGKYVYHNFLRKVRESNDFDTSTRGQVSLVMAAPQAEIPAPAAEVPVPTPETAFPEETLGATVETSES